MIKSGDVILTKIQFTDTFDIKKRPALVLFQEYDNIVVAGITSNTNINGIKLTKKEGAIKESIIKLNYIFTISKQMVDKKLFRLSSAKRKKIFQALIKKINSLNR